MSLKYDELFKMMAAQPQVKQAVADKAEKLREYLEIRWPEVNDMNSAHKEFLYTPKDRAIIITEATQGTNRPTHVVTIRHPGAVAQQAKTGFVTKAVKDVE